MCFTLEIMGVQVLGERYSVYWYLVFEGNMASNASAYLLRALHLVAAAEFAFEEGVEFAANHLLAEWGEMVYEHLSLKVVKFMLHDAGKESVDPFVVLVEVFVHVFDMNTCRTAHGFVYAGKTEATFVHGFDFGVVEFQNVGIDVGLVESCIFRIVVLEVVKGDDYHADGFANLGCSESDPIAVYHRLKHILNELFELGIVGGDVFCLLAQHGHTICIDREKHIDKFYEIMGLMSLLDYE